MDDNETPEHLEGISRILSGIWPIKPDAEEYAEIAFALGRIASGDKDALDKVTTYVRNKYSKEKNNYETFIKLKSEIGSWISWAANWTCRKSDSDT